jgi:hypothetical protein
MGEYWIDAKLHAAERGDIEAIRQIKYLDPSFDPSNPVTPEQRIQLGSEFANSVHGAKDPRTLPGWMLKDTALSAFFKLAGWNIAQTNNFMRNVVTPATRGNPVPLLMSTLGIFGGYVVQRLREDVLNKKSNIPSFTDIASSDLGVGGNLGAVGYNLAAMANFSGYAGVLSMVPKWMMDKAFKNKSQAAVFPLDEEVSGMMKVLNNVVQTIETEGFNANYVHVGTQAMLDLIKNNVQLGRVVYNHAVEHGAFGELENEKFQTTKKLQQLRAFKQVSGLPFEEQGANEENPYLNLEQKRFKRTQDIGEAVHALPELVSNIISRYSSNPDVMMAKFRSLKSNAYDTMPSVENEPLQFFRYLRFLNAKEGNDAATSYYLDYMHHKAVNEAKSGMVP